MVHNDVTHIVSNVYRALEEGDILRLLSLHSENAVLEWGPFTFKGKSGIKEWAMGLRGMFHALQFRVDQSYTQGDEVIQDFTMRITALDGRLGLMVGAAKFKIEAGKIQHLTITPLKGILFIKEKELA